MASKGNNTAARKLKLAQAAASVKSNQRTDVLPRYLAGSTYTPRHLRRGRK